MRLTNRPGRVLASALALGLVLGACGSEGSSDSDGSSDTTEGESSAAAEGSIASTFVLGGPPECPERPLCLVGLEETYGLEFEDFTPLDAGGPLTVAALEGGDIDVGLLFTTDGQIAAKGWVLLEDDEGLQPAENITPIVNSEIAEAYGDEIAAVVDPVSEALTTEDLTELNKQVSVDLEDPDAAATAWVEENGFIPEGEPTPKDGPTIVVGSADFAESTILANIYADVLEANGFPVERKLEIGSREIYLPALQDGEIGFVPDYSGTLLTFVDESATPTADSQETYDALVTALEAEGLVALAFSPAEDKNGFVVTAETAEEYGLSKVSDLAKPAPEN